MGNEGVGKKGGEKKTYVPGEIVKGSRDAEDALKRFKEDQGRFVRPIVSVFFFGSFPPPLEDDANFVDC